MYAKYTNNVKSAPGCSFKISLCTIISDIAMLSKIWIRLEISQSSSKFVVRKAVNRSVACIINHLQEESPGNAEHPTS
ncbi:hypothetical protein EZS27_034204 [termite gut metagenome]|uniref:Uncharacterized protein n=1 Tax=termite gut metagenome TaxID=433724 RepID=A0A5J4Q2N6_9ZZZZ